MKREERASKETYRRVCTSVSHSLDADSEELAIVPRRLVPVFEESTIVQRHNHQTSPGENVRDGRHPAWKSPVEIVYRNRTNCPRCNSDIAIFVKSKIARNLCYYGTSRRKKRWWMLRTVDNCEMRNGHAFEFCEAHCGAHRDVSYINWNSHIKCK